MQYDIDLGKKQEDIDYIVRPGSYAIISNEEGEIALVRTSTGYFLPGGGVESDETHHECLSRECIEEIGHKVEIEDYLGRISQSFYSTTKNIHMESEGHFYKCVLDERMDVETEEDHTLEWLSYPEAIDVLFLKNQSYAIKEYAYKYLIYI